MVNKNNENTIENIEKIRSLLKNADEEFNHSLISDNKIIFKCGNDNYRVRFPTAREENEAIDARNRYNIKLLKDDEYVSQKQLIDLWKKKGIDIEEIDKKIQEIQTKINDKMLKLATTMNEDKKGLDFLKKEIEALQYKQYELSIEKTNHLQFCIEKRVSEYFAHYITYLCTEKEKIEEVDGTKKKMWVKAWDSYENYENDSTDISLKAFTLMTKLLLYRRIG